MSRNELGTEIWPNTGQYHIKVCPTNSVCVYNNEGRTLCNILSYLLSLASNKNNE